MIAPKDQTVQETVAWLASEGLKATVSPRSDSIILEASISRVEALLNTTYEAFVRAETGDVVVRTLQYSLPASLQGHVDSVQPTTFFGFKPMGSMV